MCKSEFCMARQVQQPSGKLQRIFASRTVEVNEVGDASDVDWMSVSWPRQSVNYDVEKLAPAVTDSCTPHECNPS